MPSFRTRHAVSHTPEQMFALVADVEKYPEFLPFCTALTLKRSAKDSEGRDVLICDMHVGYKSINERFTSRVALDRANLTINVDYIDGPFRFLENKWRFEPDPKGSAIDFYISYEFRSRLLATLAGAVFDRIFRMFTGAFDARADVVYGAGGTLRAPTEAPNRP
ncbi:MAG: ubiquinone-binding protein [Rhizobiales bacterium 65-9]|nr:SRPBCC family protein [Hyphomicrobiales bacterium]OJY35667.1 MAG: ubiquinone-binding protein [Rhizobiales bacterium 65-9]